MDPDLALGGSQYLGVSMAQVAAQTQDIYSVFGDTWTTDINTDHGCTALCPISLIKLLLIFTLMPSQHVYPTVPVLELLLPYHVPFIHS